MKPGSNWVRLSKALYFVYYGAGASLFPFLALYYQSLNLGGEQIGVLRAIPSLLMLLVAPIWAGLADATRRHKLILMLALSGTLAASVLLSAMRSFWALAPVVVMYAVFSAPVMSIVDSSVVAMLQGERARYGRLRLWGAVGWGLVGPVVGVLVQRYSLSWAFYGYYVMFGAALLIAFRMPIHAGKLRTSFWSGFGELARNRGWLFFLGTMFLYTAGRAALETFLFLHLESIGVTRSLMGLSLAVASVSELPVYFWSDRLLQRFGPKGLLVISMLSTAVMALAVGWMRAPWLILVIQLLHGPSFSAMWVAGVSYVAQIAPEGMGATAQGIFGSVSMGIGSAVASLLGGFLFARLGGPAMYTIDAGLVLAALGLFVWGARRMFAPAAHPALASAPAE
jgi:PPP family 3-phenylpropionic acid transporter